MDQNGKGYIVLYDMYMRAHIRTYMLFSIGAWGSFSGTTSKQVSNLKDLRRLARSELCKRRNEMTGIYTYWR